jgi:hypothetical protein
VEAFEGKGRPGAVADEPFEPFPVGGLEGAGEDVEDGAGGAGPVVEIRPQTLGNREDELADGLEALTDGEGRGPPGELRSRPCASRCMRGRPPGLAGEGHQESPPRPGTRRPGFPSLGHPLERGVGHP